MKVTYRVATLRRVSKKIALLGNLENKPMWYFRANFDWLDHYFGPLSTT